ncbi:DHS-like NAD/FAD-binding domain-containing protein [Melanogaster broomeanus]|nr:DHS-like NAD/FAD-binding domain-containing protein [Melanogaster broomeanus]
MTLLLPLEEKQTPPSAPSFLIRADNATLHLRKAVRAILKARRLVVVCGAGISVNAGIPDFRSSTGLFQTLKRDNPKEALTSGRDLFDASVFNSEHTTSLFCQMIAQLSELSQAASPTPFHQLLRSLDERGGLLRVYTQNIDAIESKSGLSFGIPEFEDKRHKPRSKGKPSPSASPADAIAFTSSSSSQPFTSRLTPVYRHRRPKYRVVSLFTAPSRRLHCQTCTHTFPLEDHMDSLTSGTPPYCPECTQMEETRQLVGKRARGVGKLRPSVVLYNEMHKDGEGVGEVVRRDLVGSSKGKGRSGADVLLVVGTSLRVPGTKRIVREFSKAVRARGSNSIKDKDNSESTPQCPLTPTPTTRRSSEDGCYPMKSIYLNLDFPVPTREWEGVFDAWVQGDAQSFAQMLMEEITKEAVAKEAALERKRKREEEVAHCERGDVTDQPVPHSKKPKSMSQNPGKPVSTRKPKPSDAPSDAPRKPRSDKKSANLAGAKTVAAPALKPVPSEKVVIRIPGGRHLVPEVVIPPPPPVLALIKERSFSFTPPATQYQQRMLTSGQEHDDKPYPTSDNTESDLMDDSDLSGDCSDAEVPDELPTALSLPLQCSFRRH